MKYTKESLYEGFVFISNGEQYKMTNIRESNCALRNLKTGWHTPNYYLKDILINLNSDVYKEPSLDYQIY